MTVCVAGSEELRPMVGEKEAMTKAGCVGERNASNRNVRVASARAVRLVWVNCYELVCLGVCRCSVFIYMHGCVLTHVVKHMFKWFVSPMRERECRHFLFMRPNKAAIQKGGT